MIRLSAALVLLLALFAGSALAQEIRINGIALEQPWVRASAGTGKTSAAYITLTNHGREADRLIGAESPIAAQAMIHQTVNEGGVMKMGHVAAIELPPGVTVDLSPGGHHIMLMDLKQPLKEGTSIPLALIFEKAGRVQIVARVLAVGASGGHN